MNLPTTKIKAERVNPKKIVIFSNPKVGKSTAVAELPNNLIIDLESGTGFIDAMKIDVLEEARKEGVSAFTMLMKVVKAISDANREKGDYVYRFITLDTATALEEIAKELGLKLYKRTPMGKNFTGDDVTKLPNGAGYLYLREAMEMILNEFDKLCDTLIILGHLKAKFVEKEGKEMESRGLDLTGKLASILCSQVDAIGYMYRDGEFTKVNFQPSESLVVGSRPEHLKGQVITLIEADATGKLKVDWSKIFLD